MYVWWRGREKRREYLLSSSILWRMRFRLECMRFSCLWLWFYSYCAAFSHASSTRLLYLSMSFVSCLFTWNDESFVLIYSLYIHLIFSFLVLCSALLCATHSLSLNYSRCRFADTEAETRPLAEYSSGRFCRLFTTPTAREYRVLVLYSYVLVHVWYMYVYGYVQHSQ